MKVYNTNYEIFAKKGSKNKYIYIGDLHGWINNKQIYKVIENILAQNPDIIMIAGDILNDSKSWADKNKLAELRTILNLLSMSGAQVITVLGNHDTHRITDELLKNYLNLEELSNVHPLYNSCVNLTRNDEKIHIAGLTTEARDGVTAYQNRFAKKNGIDQRPARIVKTLEPLLKLNEEDTNILLTHDCRQLRMKDVDEATKKFDVRLAAHIHNGYLPFEKTLKDKKYLDQDWQHYLSFGTTPLKTRNYARGVAYGNGEYYILCTQTNDYYLVKYNQEIKDIGYFEISKKEAIILINQNNLTPTIITGGINRYIGIPYEGSETTAFTLKKRL